MAYTVVIVQLLICGKQARITTSLFFVTVHGNYVFFSFRLAWPRLLLQRRSNLAVLDKYCHEEDSRPEAA